MTIYSAITTVPGRGAADALAEALGGELDPAPAGVGICEIEDGRGLWEVAGWFEARPDPAALAILALLYEARDFAVSEVADRDWVAQVRRELHPVEAGRFTVHGAHDAGSVGPHRIGLLIEAAMAFGTGHHGTTRGCLLMLERLLRAGFRPRRVADIGSGTGVLAMAAARTLRVRCIASDIDPVARETAAENVRANRLSPWVRCLEAAGFRHAGLAANAPYELVFANILAAPLKRLAADMSGHIAPGGVAVLSGLLTRQAPGVEAVYRGHGFRRIERIVLGDWATLALRRRPSPECSAPRRTFRSAAAPTHPQSRAQRSPRPAR